MDAAAWASDTDDLFCATVGDPWNLVRHRIVVEALPGGGWDWQAWATDGSRRALRGTADSRVAAMAAAERAASLLRRVDAARRRWPADCLDRA